MIMCLCVILWFICIFRNDYVFVCDIVVYLYGGTSHRK